MKLTANERENLLNEIEKTLGRILTRIYEIETKVGIKPSKASYTMPKNEISDNKQFLLLSFANIQERLANIASYVIVGSDDYKFIINTSTLFDNLSLVLMM